MSNGLAFLQTQIGAAVTAHSAFLQSLIEDEAQADDQRLRDLCARHIPAMREHQHQLEQLHHSLSTGPASAGGVTQAIRRVADTAVSAVRTLADVARVDDYNRLAANLVLSKECELAFKVFRDGGRTLGITSLASVGEAAERHHDAFNAEANRLLEQLFVERARGASEFVRSTTKWVESPEALP